MKSPVESYRTPGLQQARRFKVCKNSTRVTVEQILRNVSSTKTEWSVWEVTQAVIDHDGTGDYENISTYFPTSESDIKVLMGSKIPTSAVEENVRKFNYAGSGWKIGTLLKEGWGCFVDERDEQTYAKIFDIDRVSGQYPDKNSDFQLYVGGSYIEIEVLGPLTEIAQGDSTAYTESWYAAKIKGDILTANHAGAVRSRLSYNASTLSVNGEYGIFNSGSLHLKYFDAAGLEIDSDDPVAVNATDKFILDAAISMPEGTDAIKLMAYDAEVRLIGVLDSFSVSSATAKADKNKELSCRVYPTITESVAGFTIEVPAMASDVITVEIHSMADGKLAGKHVFAGNASGYSINTTGMGPGIYMITIQQSTMVFREKIIIL
jgi:hypothetical protein